MSVGIKFVNIKSKQLVVAETEPHISALWASSDRGPNAMNGQDFGWRLAPAVVVEVKKIKQDFPKLLEIAKVTGKNVDEINEPDIIMYLANTDPRMQNVAAEEGDYSDEYDQEIRDLEGVTTTTTTLSIEELEAQLAARLAAKEAKAEKPVKP